MAAVDPFAPQETRFRREFLIGAGVLAMLLAAVHVSSPGIDLAISSAVREVCPVPQAAPGAPWCPTAAVSTARKAFMAIFLFVAFATLIVSIRVFLAERRWFGLDQARCLFMIAVLVMGPGVVANLVFKDNLGRARPRDVVEFGGTKAFTPPLIPSRECPRNCSFISGEASSMFAAFFALALLLPQYRLGLLIIGLAAGTLAGAVRIMQGAHFLSDVLFAGIFMAFTVSLLHIAFIGLWRDPKRTWGVVAAPFTPLMRVAIERMR
ncbi:phosphatase PAP2 family protein [Hyphomicrobium sp.]|uniref:phosphatase PAP2 family protein n=1 Tax=Hyphomicrobium sp. TaxID=82 RepID=UPI0025BA8952|nr:phosphatase PAP2 family protein [Hyphomicrobium sp.]MCC7254238.1 phosphatase PAP2 family protein [Hyphomicrobium sp.]